MNRCSQWCALLAIALLATTTPAQTRPDIVLIVADDLGYSDLGCYGGEIHTPNLDRLAANGVRFRQFYNAARCCPTRASLLTGLYAHAAGVGLMEQDHGHPGYTGDLSPTSPTIAEVLRPAGYATMMAGKWHLASVIRSRDIDDKWNWPVQRGFNRFYGTLKGGGNYFQPDTLTRHNRAIEREARLDPDFYYTDAISEHAALFITEHAERAPDVPFFLYVAYTAPHWPMQARPEDIETYRGAYDIGWDEVRRQRADKQQSIGLWTDAWSLSDRPDWIPAWNDIRPRHVHDDLMRIDGFSPEAVRELSASRMAIYAAMVTSMDRGIGHIIHALEQTGRLDDTLLIFMSDNGACAETNLFGFTWTDQPTMQEGGPDSYVSYGAGWANAGNTPFRRFKHHMHEGGIASPFIVHWPAQIDTPGQWRDQIAHIIDLMPTFMEVTGAERQQTFGGEPTRPLPGVSLLPALQDQPLPRTQPLFWEHHGNRAVRDGKWKLVAHTEQGPWELYDLSTDRAETRDIATDHPQIVRRLSNAWWDWADANQVLPMNPPVKADE